MSDSEEEAPVLKRSESLRDKTWLFSSSRLRTGAMFPKSARKELWYTYGLSSFSFSMIGLLMIYDRCHNSWVAIFLEFLLVLQGPISFLNDVHYLGYPTVWRPIDRFWATFTTIVAVIYIAWFGWTAELECTPRKDQFMVMWPTIVLGISFYACSYQAAKKKDIFKYQIFHIFWHLSLPCAGSYVVLFWLYNRISFEAIMIYFSPTKENCHFDRLSTKKWLLISTSQQSLQTDVFWSIHCSQSVEWQETIIFKRSVLSFLDFIWLLRPNFGPLTFNF